LGPGVVVVAVHAVGGLQQRGTAVLAESALVHHRHRDLRAVARGRPQSLGDVLLRVVADHRLALHQPALAGDDVELVGGGRGGHRGVAITQPVGVRLGVDVQAHAVGRFVGLDVLAVGTGLAAPAGGGVAPQLDALQPLPAPGDPGEGVPQPGCLR